MSHNVRVSLILTVLIGLGAGLWAIWHIGLASLAQAALQLGVGGFLLYCLGTLGMTAVLGGAWLAAMPGEPLGRLGLFAWARLAREAANDILPFSQLGGLVVGARTLVRSGLPPARTYAAMIVDMTTEMGSQIVFTLLGLTAFVIALSGDDGGRGLGPLAWAGIALMVAGTLAFWLLQRPILRGAVALAGRVLPSAEVSLDQVRAALDAIYAHRGAVTIAFWLNLAGWVIGAALAALAVRLMGQPLPLWKVMALESLIFAIRSAAFFVPGGIGVQEAGYVLLAGSVGLDPGIAVTLSLAKRARDITLGVPTLLIWQGIEMRLRPKLTGS